MKTTAAAKRHMARVAALGCCICGNDATLHHVKLEPGQPRDDSLIIPLCPLHHQNGAVGVAVQKDVRAWEENYGPQLLHVIRVLRSVEIEPSIMRQFLRRLESKAEVGAALW